MLETVDLLPFDDESPSPLDAFAEEIDGALDASFLAELAVALERVKLAREQLAAASA